MARESDLVGQDLCSKARSEPGPQGEEIDLVVPSRISPWDGRQRMAGEAEDDVQAKLICEIERVDLPDIPPTSRTPRYPTPTNRRPFHAPLTGRSLVRGTKDDKHGEVSL